MSDRTYPGGVGRMIRAILHEPLDPGLELASLTAASGKAGGVVSFVGLAREEDGGVAALVLQHHPVLTIRSLEKIAAVAKSRFAVDAVTAVHRAGTILLGEPIVFAGVAARHRRDAFLAADFLMDLLKTQAVFWKQEIGATGARWIEPRLEDLADVARWNTTALEMAKQ
ncbi:molybdenum cofactor biosynthesis protein MoaE [Croceicoccus sp. F390]|uniref:Molybdopterin synthase catalytic subunit n=1 Tax=Croceicoccus esteveae TaxID=3075597 RepID=A0ABU2ZHH7_9SPHN|nr:molybdenum cofactor biosynthesis protein MoaE [Croceicoccus sp. F390]MDT0576054.1 molybdenum cofactor biosynthesis protein MoaE [Croceicoccus sp. F390]